MPLPIVALSLTARDKGREGVSELLRRLIQWDVPVRWYVFAAVLMAAVKLAVALLHRPLVGVWPRFGDEAYPRGA